MRARTKPPTVLRCAVDRVAVEELDKIMIAATRPFSWQRSLFERKAMYPRIS